jgi:hypothetical protein
LLRERLSLKRSLGRPLLRQLKEDTAKNNPRG